MGELFAVHWFLVVWLMDRGVPEKVFTQEVKNMQECAAIALQLDKQHPDEQDISYVCIKRTVAERKA